MRHAILAEMAVNAVSLELNQHLRGSLRAKRDGLLASVAE
jgi:hypothetical protein